VKKHRYMNMFTGEILEYVDFYPPETLKVGIEYIGDEEDIKLVIHKVNRKLPPMNRHSKLLFVVPHLFIGGAETQLYYLIEGMKRLGHDTRLVVTHNTSWSGSTMWPEFDGITDCYEMCDVIEKDKDLIIHLEWCDAVIFHGGIVVSRALQLMKTLPIAIQIAHTADDVWSFNIFKESKDVINYVVCVAEWIAEKLSTAYGLYKDKIVSSWKS